MSDKSGQLSLSSLFRMRTAGLLLGAVIAAGAAGVAAQTAAKTPDASVLINSNASIVVGSKEPGPVKKAAEDLQSDFEKVFGSKPRIVPSLADAGGAAILIGERAELPEALRPAGLTDRESFSISVPSSAAKARPAKIVLLAGADMRGTIYAIYEFSQEYLGVDPLYYLTDHPPPPRPRVEIPAGLEQTIHPTGFKYYRLFNNQ